MSDTKGLEGFDFSRYQGVVDFGAVLAAEKKFGICKATQGTTEIDPQFHRNWSIGSQKLEYFGAYHFADGGLDGALQGKHFAQTVGSLSAGHILPFIDVEAYPGNRDNWLKLPLAMRRERLNNLIDAARQGFGTEVGIYTSGVANGWWADTFGLDYDHSGCPLWLAHPGSLPTLGCSPWKSAAIHQYTWVGTINGLGEGSIDLDRVITELPLKS